jgi:hypothetical protein
MDFYVGAYPAVPPPATAGGYEPEVEQRFFAALRELEGVRGLEVPFHGGQLHPHDEKAYLDLLDPRWSYVVTGLPGVMTALRADPRFGLASHSSSGRTAALEFCRRLRDAVATLQARFGRQAVRRVELHSAPRQGARGVVASQDALVDSLREVRSWDWLGATLAIEHCDAFVRGRPPQKGFLTVTQELDALAATKETRTQAGLVLNWARSAIEGRDPELPLAHLREARRKGLLAGLMFSGVCAADPVYGDWQDTHAPFAPGFGLRHVAEASVLTAERGRAWLAEGGPGLDVLGFKIQPLPASIPVEERIEYLRDAIRWLRALSG